jgi:hypothetical protein
MADLADEDVEKLVWIGLEVIKEEQKATGDF